MLAANGLHSKDKNLVDLYVDTHYVDYMLTQVTAECMYEVGELKRRVGENTEAIQRLLESHESQFRWIQAQMFKITAQASQTEQILNKNVIEKYNKAKKMVVMDAWREYMAIVKKRKAKVMRMG